MATIGDESAFDKSYYTAQYPWNQWLDGQVWLLTRGQDFSEEMDLRNFQSQATNKGRERGLKVRTAKQSRDTIAIQAIR